MYSRKTIINESNPSGLLALSEVTISQLDSSASITCITNPTGASHSHQHPSNWRQPTGLKMYSVIAVITALLECTVS